MVGASGQGAFRPQRSGMIVHPEETADNRKTLPRIATILHRTSATAPAGCGITSGFRAFA